MRYQLFCDSLQKAVSFFRTWDKSKTIRVISHLDADGISACAIITKILNEENRKYSISILRQLDVDQIKIFQSDPDDFFIFTDLGSGQLKGIVEFLNNKQIIILDHHEPEKTETPENIIHINPHLFDIDGSKEISGAGVVFLFASQLDKKYEQLAHIAIIGAIGDVQEENGFLPLNQKILDIAIKNNLISVKRGLKLFGRQTRPLHKALEYCSNPFIPGVSGSESGTIQFLTELGISPKDGSVWRKVIDLSEEETQRLVAGIVMKRFEEESPEDVLGNIYDLPDEKRGTPTKDLREFATLLNACGRMSRASCGIGACLGIEKDRQMALQTLADYKKAIVGAMNWYRDNNDKIIKGDGFLIINAGDEIPATIIGTLASIISKSHDFSVVTYVMSLARSEKDTTKVSLRISGNNNDIDLRSIVKEITNKVGGEAGGHMSAAGALIPVELEDKFIEIAKDVLLNAKYINQ